MQPDSLLAEENRRTINEKDQQADNSHGERQKDQSCRRNHNIEPALSITRVKAVLTHPRGNLLRVPSIGVSVPTAHSVGGRE